MERIGSCAHLPPLREVVTDHGLRDSGGDAPHINAGAAPPVGGASRIAH